MTALMKTTALCATEERFKEGFKKFIDSMDIDIWIEIA